MDYNAGLHTYAADHQGYVLKPPPPTTRSGRWPKIYWIGMGSKSDGLHTKAEFLRLMRTQHADVVYWRRKGDVGIPGGKIKRNDLNAWIQFSGARLI
jgi:hypothetical protein